MPELSAKYGKKRTVDLLLGILYGLLTQRIKLEEDKNSKAKVYRIGKLGERAFDRLDTKITDLYQLVDFVDESPAIAVALLKEMEQDKQELRGQIAQKSGPGDKPCGSKWVEAMVKEYCCQKLSLEVSSKDEIAEVMTEALLHLAYTAVKTSFRREAAAAKEMAVIVESMTTQWEDEDGIKKQMQEHLTEKQIRLWLAAKNSGTA